jgi:hypothetical protein
MSALGQKSRHTIKSHEREVQVNRPHHPAMGESTGEPPVGLIRFINTPIAQPFIQARNVGFVSALIASLILGGITVLLTTSNALALSIAVVSLVANASFVMNRYLGHASTPIAVNLNHPFMDGSSFGEAEVQIQLSDGKWVDTGAHRTKVISNDLIGGFNIVHDTIDFPILGHFSTAKKRTPLLIRHMALINQAIALRDAVNNIPDPIAEARGREAKESGLLERSWLEEEQEIEVESPLVSFFKREE